MSPWQFYYSQLTHRLHYAPLFWSSSLLHTPLRAKSYLLPLDFFHLHKTALREDTKLIASELFLLTGCVTQHSFVSVFFLFVCLFVFEIMLTQTGLKPSSAFFKLSCIWGDMHLASFVLLIIVFFPKK